MKKFANLLFLLCLTSLLSAQSTIYVDAGSSGSNNGTSWINAFNSLDLALAAAQPGDQLWVAQGTYKPSVPFPNNSFTIVQGVKLYGGFLNGETVFTERNPELYPTILSGDIAGDDIEDNYTDHKTDNVLHVIQVNAGTSANAAVLDGFTIRSGQTSLVATDPAANRRGAGMVISGKIQIENCKFTQNKAENGSCIVATDASANGLKVINCVFEKNETDTRCSGIYAIALNGLEIRNTIFQDNKSVRGTIYPFNSTNVVIDNCIFQNNEHKLAGSGANLFVFDSDFTVTNSQFKNNTSGNGAGIYISNALANKYFNIKKCLFEGNVATDYGGTSIQTFAGNLTVDSCTFLNNTAPSSGAGLYNGNNTYFTVSNCHFEGHTGNYAPVAANYGTNCIGSYVNCVFKNNNAINGGGACSNGFKADVAYVGCTFQGNTANFGGAIFTQNDTTRLTVTDCLFTDNGATTNGGAILKNSNITADITNSVFTANSAESGGALYAVGDSAIVVHDCIFSDNLGLTQGPVANLSNTDAEFVNCLMVRNLNVSSEGAGGTVINNASDGLVSTAKLVNCTIADNLAPIGGGIAQWEDDTSNAVIILQNCLIQNIDGGNYGIEAGAPELTSLGGNQSSDATMVTELTASKDLNGTENTFVNPDDNNYHLSPGPAVDGGIAAGAPAADIEGTVRIGLPDVGAYEWGTTGINTAALKQSSMTATPNPATVSTVLSINSEWSGSALLEVIDQNGKVVRSLAVEKTTGNWQYTLQVADLPAGAYRILLTGKDYASRAVIVKQ